METVSLLIVGIVLVVIGCVNMTGNISTIHAYNRRKVTEEDAPKYGKAVGMGTVVIGGAVLAAFALELLGLSAAVPFVLLPAVAVGLGLILYAQFKYNKGIF